MELKNGQVFIKSRWFTPKTYSMAINKGIKSRYKRIDYVQQALSTPTATNPAGILCEFQNVPLAYYDIPTLNNMVFEQALWQDLRNDEGLQSRMLTLKSFWGEPDHDDSTEIRPICVSHKVADFWVDDAPYILGSIQICDTPYGNIIYSLSQSGFIGTSSRGWGTLVKSNRADKAKIVSRADYYHLCWDMVARPAVPEAVMTLQQSIQKDKKLEEAFNSFYSDMKGDVIQDFKPLFSTIMQERKKTFAIRSSISQEDHFKEAGDSLIFEVSAEPTTNLVKVSVMAYKKDAIGKVQIGSFDAVLKKDEFVDSLKLTSTPVVVLEGKKAMEFYKKVSEYDAEFDEFKGGDSSPEPSKVDSTMKVLIKKNGVFQKDFQDIGSARIWMLRNQPNSIKHALSYGGWTVEDESGKPIVMSSVKPVFSSVDKDSIMTMLDRLLASLADKSVDEAVAEIKNIQDAVNSSSIEHDHKVEISQLLSDILNQIQSGDPTMAMRTVDHIMDEFDEEQILNSQSPIKSDAGPGGAGAVSGSMPGSAPVSTEGGATNPGDVENPVRKPLGIADPAPTGSMNPADSSEDRAAFNSDLAQYFKGVLGQDTNIQALQDESSLFRLEFDDTDGKIKYIFKEVDFDNILPDEESQEQNELLPEDNSIVLQLQEGFLTELSSDFGQGVLWSSESYKQFNEGKKFDLFSAFDGNVSSATVFLLSPIVASQDSDVTKGKEASPAPADLQDGQFVEQSSNLGVRGKLLASGKDGMAFVAWKGGRVSNQLKSSLSKARVPVGSSVVKFIGSEIAPDSSVKLKVDGRVHGQVMWASPDGLVVKWSDGSQSVVKEADVIETESAEEAK